MSRALGPPTRDSTEYHDDEAVEELDVLSLKEIAIDLANQVCFDLACRPASSRRR